MSDENGFTFGQRILSSLILYAGGLYSIFMAYSFIDYMISNHDKASAVFPLMVEKNGVMYATGHLVSFFITPNGVTCLILLILFLAILRKLKRGDEV